MTNGNKPRLKAKVKTIAELVEEIRRSFDSTAAKYIPQLSYAVKAENPKLSRKQQREKIEAICLEFWKPKTIMDHLPHEFKDEKRSFAGKLGSTRMLLNRAAREEEFARHEASKDQEEEEYPRSPISLEQERKHDDSVDNQYHYLRSLIELLAGVDYVKERDSNLALVDKTKDHRFKLVKQLSDLDVKAIYTDGRTLAHILNDYLKLLDNELDVRKAKEELASE